MATFSINAAHQSRPRVVGKDNVVTIRPAAGATAIVEYTTGTSADITNNAASWRIWPKGNVTTATSDQMNNNGFIRVTAIGGNVAYDISEQVSGTDAAAYRADWQSAIGASGAPTLSGQFVVGGSVKAQMPPDVFATLQFTRTLKAPPYTKSTLGAAIVGVNSATYSPILAGDAIYNIGCDASAHVSSSIKAEIYVAPATPDLGGLRAASDRLYINQNRSTASKQIGGSRTIKLGTDVTAVNLRYANWFVDGFAQTTPTYTELGSGGAAVFTGAIEYPAGVFTQALISGSPNGAVADGAEVVLTATVSIPANTEFKVHSYQNQTGAGFIVHGGSGGSAGTPTVTSTTAKDITRGAVSGLTDATMTGNWAAAGGSDITGNAFGPISISGVTTKPSVLILGTSIDHGEGGTQATVFNSGLVCVQLAAAGIGFINAGVRSDSVRKSNAADAKRMALGNSSEITTIYFGGPVNDVTSASPTRTAAEIFADIQAEWAKYPTKNKIQGTMTPLTSDGAGTTAIARAQVWRDVNDLIRNNTNGVKVWDFAAVMSNGGAATCVWFTGDTIDGTHPTNQGYNRVRSSGVVNIADIT